MDAASWAFTGIGAAIVGALLTVYLTKNSKSRSMTQRSGHHSTNIQAGRDVRRRDEGPRKRDR